MNPSSTNLPRNKSSSSEKEEADAAFVQIFERYQKWHEGDDERSARGRYGS
jgi:hypothetical protein